MNNIIRFFTTTHLAIAVIGLIAGIAFTLHFTYSCILGFLFLMHICTQSNHLTRVTIFSLFFLCGLTRYYQQKDAYFSHTRLLHKKCTIKGTVTAIDLGQATNEQSTKIELAVDTIVDAKTIYSVHKKIYLFVPAWQKIWVIPHQKISIENIVLNHPKTRSYETYLIKEKIWAVAHLQYFRYTTIQKPHEFFIWYHNLCQQPLQKMNSHLSEQAHYLYLSVFCGKKIKTITGNELKHLFQYWGLSHHLARSGLHLVLLLWILFFLFSCIPCSLIKKQIMIGSIVFVYYLMTFSSVAFLRSFCMYIAYIACKGLQVPINTLHILLLTTFGILWCNPYHLFFLDFQLSFSITFLILWFFSQTQKLKTVAL